MRAAKIDSPRGPISFSTAHNVVQNIYVREVKGGLNRYISVAHANLADPARGCRLPA
jgi:branched-chain amino acid transport system substrate-binding protein